MRGKEKEQRQGKKLRAVPHLLFLEEGNVGAPTSSSHVSSRRCKEESGSKTGGAGGGGGVRDIAEKEQE